MIATILGSTRTYEASEERGTFGFGAELTRELS